MKNYESDYVWDFDKKLFSLQKMAETLETLLKPSLINNSGITSSDYSEALKDNSQKISIFQQIRALSVKLKSIL